MSNKRDEVIEATCRLLELQGFHATGMNQILHESGTPKGSLYYYFPDGKEGLAVVAIERSRREISGRIADAMSEIDDPTMAIVTFIQRLAEVVAASGYRQGGPITAVALEAASTSEVLRLACRDAFREWQEIFAAKLRPVYGEAAEHLAIMLVSVIEGGVILARTENSPEPLRAVAVTVEEVLQSR
jgi:TetR/AcrR family transcriptional regulator, lmrAB and yxaGH operons repressor